MYDVRERSEEDAEPVELYEFTVYNEEFLYNTSNDEQTVALKVYASEAMKRSKPDAGTEIPRQNISVNTRVDHPMTVFYDGTPPSTVVLLKIFRWHRGDVVPQPFWAGRVLNCAFKGEEAVFYCESIYTSLRRTGLRRLYGRGCPYELYGSECNVIEQNFRTPVTLTGVDGTLLTGTGFSSQADGKFVGGYLTWEPTPGIRHRRAIIAHAGNDATVTHAIKDIAINAVVNAHIGCAHDISDCNDTFANIENYGGLAPFMQKLNPFGGGNVF